MRRAKGDSARPGSPEVEGDAPERVSGVGELRRGEERETDGNDRPSRTQAKAPSDGPLAAPTPDRVLSAVLRLNRQVSVEMREEDIVHSYVTTLGELFPGRELAVRVLARDGQGLSLAYATRAIDPARREPIELSRAALEHYDLGQEVLVEGDVHIANRYRPILRGTGHGFDLPLVEGARLIGVVAVEYPPGVDEPPEDRVTLGQITLQLAAALRNARLLRESIYLRDYLTKLLDHANAPIVVIGRKREVRVVNQALLNMVKMDRGQLLGVDFIELLPRSERRRLLPVFVNALRGRPTVNVEVKLPRRDGGMARMAANVASILSADDEVEGVIAIGRDLTELKELEEQVIQAEKLATLGQLAAGVVHELNNPLTSISVYADYLKKKYEGNDAEGGDVEKLRRINQSAERILRFTRDLVTYARPSTEAPRYLSIHDELDQAIVFCEHIIEETGARVDKRYAADISPVYGVQGQLHQVFINLITNACHAMPEGAGKLVIVTGTVDEEHIEILVSDNGSGVPSEDRARIFEPFFTTKGEGRGTGLGLSIVRNIVEQHGGSIDVASELGSGTTFRIVLPAQPELPR
jgi:PAS domain S-box-containing protein